MKQDDKKSRFKAKLLRPANFAGDSPWAFVVLPKEVSATLPRRGRVTVDASIDGHGFQSTLEPDGQLSHWLKIDEALLEAAGKNFGDIATFDLMSVAQEPEPELPSDLCNALAASPAAKAVWDETTTIARLDWIHWITSAKQAKTRTQRVNNACDMLASGKKRVCCFDSSGYYSKSFSAPKT